MKDGEPVALSSRQFDLLHLLVARAGQVLSKDALIETAWSGVAVTDNSLEQAISSLRRILAAPDTTAYIETQARRGYRFAAEVRRVDRREPEEALEALLAPHRAWVEGRAALETLERSQILRAREVFERVIEQVPDQASAHVGLANAGIMQFEMTRSELAPDTAALAVAAEHAREACRLDPAYGEAWATLGLRPRSHRQPCATRSRRREWPSRSNPTTGAITCVSPMSSWGEERLREARRTLTLLPGFPLAHWLAATVHVARQALDEAERELTMRARRATRRSTGPVQRRCAALAARPDHARARRRAGGAANSSTSNSPARDSGQLYARECCANTWYAIGALRLHRGDGAGAGNGVRPDALTRAAASARPVALLAGLRGRTGSVRRCATALRGI